jgi:transglutaminase superfamily protein
MGERRRVRAADVPLLARMILWRGLLPVLRRAVATDRLVRLTASPRQRQRDAAREALVLASAGRLWRRSEGTCLERSLAVYAELGRCGSSPHLILAMAREADELVGHAWVENGGRAVLEREDPRAIYVAVLEYDATGRRIDAQ